MAKLTYGNFSFTVDHAVKGSDYIHGYLADGSLVISLDGITNFGLITYDGEYMSPAECLEEPCNTVKYVAGALVKNDGTRIDSKIKYGTTTVTDGSASPYAEGTLYVVIEGE
jgi:hypothetical protein